MSSDSRSAGPYTRALTPELSRIARVAEALGTQLRERVVFIGGSIMPLLQTNYQVFSSPRATVDVDGAIITANYTAKAKIEEELRSRKFRNDPTGHMDRWITPDGTVFDLVSCGNHAGGTASEIDRFAIETASAIDLPPIIRHANAVGFLVLKCGAFWDRGSKNAIMSKDLMDIVVLIATRDELVSEFHASTTPTQSFIADAVRRILEAPRIVSAIPTHIKDRDPLTDDVEDIVMRRMRILSE